MFVLIGLSAPSPGALAREVRDVSAVVATRSLVQVALVLLNSWAMVRAGAPPTVRHAFALSALSPCTNIGFYFAAEYHYGIKRTVATLATLNVTAFLLITAYVHVAM